MDKMDIFGVRYISGFNAISKYLVIEIKKDIADIEAVNQIMKYVDWINIEYAFGDYDMIEAFIVASGFSKDVIEYKNSICIRNYTKGRRPIITSLWKSVRLIEYKFENGNLNFYEIE